VPRRELDQVGIRLVIRAGQVVLPPKTVP